MPEKVSLQKSYSGLNEKLAKLFDESGVRRSFTIPYIEGQETHEHIAAVGKAAAQAGGMASNFVTTMHHSDGKGWGSGDGHTLGHPVDKLRTTTIPREAPKAQAVIDAAQKYLKDIGKLVGDDEPSVQTANGQLNLVKKTQGAGMSLLDFGVMMIQLTHRPTQTIARAISGAKEGGHAPHLRGPAQASPESQAGPQGEASVQGGAPEGQAAASAPQGAPGAPAAAPVQA